MAVPKEDDCRDVYIILGRDDMNEKIPQDASFRLR